MCRKIILENPQLYLLLTRMKLITTTEKTTLKYTIFNLALEENHLLYQEMFAGNDPADMDLLQILKSREPDSEKNQTYVGLFFGIIRHGKALFELSHRGSVLSHSFYT